MSRKGQEGCLDKKKQQVLSSPFSRLSKRACLPLETLSPPPPLHLSLTVFSSLSRQLLGIDVGALQEHLDQAEQERRKLINQHQMTAGHL